MKNQKVLNTKGREVTVNHKTVATTDPEGEEHIIKISDPVTNGKALKVKQNHRIVEGHDR